MTDGCREVISLQKAAAILLPASMGSQNTIWQWQSCNILCHVCVFLYLTCHHPHPKDDVDPNTSPCPGPQGQHKDSKTDITLPSIWWLSRCPTQACLLCSSRDVSRVFRKQALWHHSSGRNFPSSWPHVTYCIMSNWVPHVNPKLCSTCALLQVTVPSYASVSNTCVWPC